MSANLTLRQLRAFAAVAELGSFTAAAARMHLTQSALSVLVRELEHELGARLFDRHTRRVLLTEAGHELLPSARRVLGEVAQAAQAVAELRDKNRGRLRLAMPQLMASTLGAQAIAAFHRRHPGVAIELHDTLTDRLVAQVLSGEVELAIGVEVPSGADIERRVLLRDRHWLVCPAAHALARRARLRWADLRGVPFIAPTRDFMRWLEPLLAPRALLPAPAHTVGYVSTALGLVAAGLGVTLVPTYGATLAQARGLVLRALVAPVFERDVQIYSAPGRSLTPAAQAFVAELQSLAARPGAPLSSV
ncbi:MAG TPA: LysR substrate-binding domain-containing protein [Rubrivivax sp.]|nr:LysR substrate-binding domain-containing protein [Rubrivivax sp.]